MRKSLLIFVVLFSLIIPANAQDDSDCDVETFKDKYASRIADVETLDDLKSIQVDLALALANCEPRNLPLEDEDTITFSGKGNDVIGPFETEPGWYVFEYAVEGDDTLEVDWINDKASRPSQLSDWNPGNDDVDIEGRRIDQFEAGKYLGNVETDGTWTLIIYPIDPNTATQAFTTVSGVNSGDDFIIFEIDPGLYIMEFDITSHPTDNWASGVQFDFLEGRVDPYFGETAEGSWNGRKAYNFSGGLYILNLNPLRVTEWSITLVPQ